MKTQKTRKILSRTNTKGITLIALVITIIVLLMLAAITINIVAKGGIIDFTKQSKDNWEDTANETKNDISNLIADLNEEFEFKNYSVQLNFNVKSYEATLGEFPIICNVTGKKNGKAVYSDIAEVKITKPGISSVDLVVYAPEGTNLTVSEVYGGANYNLTTQKDINYELVDETQITKYEFEHEYNYKLIGNSSLSI